MELLKKNGNIVIVSEKREIEFLENAIVLDGMDIDFPGEYEKSGFLLAMHEIQDKRLFCVRIEGKNIAYIPTDTLEITEEVVDFFGNIDILVILGDKNSTKIFENLETYIVLPYGPEKDLFLTALGQHSEAIEKYKVKEADFEGEGVLFLNLA